MDTDDLLEKLKHDLAELESDPTATPDDIEVARHMLRMARLIEERKKAAAWKGQRWVWPEERVEKYG